MKSVELSEESVASYVLPMLGAEVLQRVSGAHAALGRKSPKISNSPSSIVPAEVKHRGGRHEG